MVRRIRAARSIVDTFIPEQNVALRTYKDLEAWREGIELAVQIYEWTDGFPKFERFGISSQMCRAAVWVPSNVAEANASQCENSCTMSRTLAVRCTSR